MDDCTFAAALEPSRERCAVSPVHGSDRVPGLLPATEPLVQDPLHPVLGSPKVDIGIVDPGKQVHSGDNVRITIPPAVQAVETYPRGGSPCGRSRTPDRDSSGW